MTMHKRVKGLWIAALESGDYNFGKGYLKFVKDGTLCHCSVGVLCDLHSIETGEPWGLRAQSAYPVGNLLTNYLGVGGKLWEYQGWYATTGPHVESWSGLDYMDGTAVGNINDKSAGDYVSVIEHIRANL